MKRPEFELLTTALLFCLATCTDPRLGEMASLPTEPGNRAEAQSHHQAALAAHAQGDYSRSASLWKQAAQSDPSWWAPFYNLACATSLSGEPALALEFLRLAANREYPPRFHSMLASDSDLIAVRELSAYSDFLADLHGNSPYGEFASVIGVQLTCTASSTMTDGHPDTMTRYLSPDGSLSGTDFGRYFYGSNMTEETLVGGNWEIRSGVLVITETRELVWSSIPMNAERIGQRSVNELEYASVDEFKQLFAKPACDVSSTF